MQECTRGFDPGLGHVGFRHNIIVSGALRTVNRIYAARIEQGPRKRGPGAGLGRVSYRSTPNVGAPIFSQLEDSLLSVNGDIALAQESVVVVGGITVPNCDHEVTANMTERAEFMLARPAVPHRAVVFSWSKLTFSSEITTHSLRQPFPLTPLYPHALFCPFAAPILELAS